MNDVYVYLSATEERGTVINAGAAEAQAANSQTGTGTEVPVATNSGGLFGGIGWSWILIYVVVIGGYIWFLSRNNKKKEKKIAQMRDALKIGDNVCTTSGMFGKLVEIGEDVFVVEFGTNRGIRVPVVKGDVVAARDPILKGGKAEKAELAEN